MFEIEKTAQDAGMVRRMGPIERLRNEKKVLQDRLNEIDMALTLADKNPEVIEVLETIARISHF